MSARSRAFCSAFSRLGYDAMAGKINRSGGWKSHPKGQYLPETIVLDLGPVTD